MRIGYSNSPVEHDDDPEFEHLEDLRCPKNIIFRAFFGNLSSLHPEHVQHGKHQ
jgi:hypothetical protein